MPEFTTTGFQSTPTMKQHAILGQSTVIPKYVPAGIRSQLAQELSRPISKFDEAGYIYMYRKVDQFSAPAKNLASAQAKIRPGEDWPKHVGAQLDLREMNSNALGPGKILVKIGYTTNVQSRLSAWTGKCGAKVELLRYYPHTPSGSNTGQPRKALHCHRVERLIHIELSSKRIKHKCDCGSIHREWFEVEATVDAVRAVDEVIRRWVSWAEQRAPYA